MRSSRSRWVQCLIALAFVATLVLGGRYILNRGKAGAAAPHAESTPSSSASEAVAVDLISPKAGGVDRVCLQPGSVEPFQAADLYSKVSGYLIEQKVDIGFQVKAGDILARISVPEYEKQVKQDAAEVEMAEARVAQMKASLKSSEAEFVAASAMIGLAQADKKNKEAKVSLADKQRKRIDQVVSKGAINAQVADELLHEYESAVSANLAAAETVKLARHKEGIAQAHVAQAQADVKYAESQVLAAKARLEKSQVLLDYTIIRAPYSGVITKRNFHPGDFVRSAEAGGERVPLLAVERTDIMRVIIQVPERDVPYVDRGDPAVVEVDALPGVVFKSQGDNKVEISRLAASEDPQTRMMRTEVHIKNADGKLRRGMFGRVKLILQGSDPAILRIPSAALSGKSEGGKATVRVARNGKAAFVPILIGTDNGTEVEVLSGLKAEDRIILRAAGAINEGTAVTENERQ